MELARRGDMRSARSHPSQKGVSGVGFGLRASNFSAHHAPSGRLRFEKKKLRVSGFWLGKGGGGARYHAVFEEFVEVRLRYRARDLGRRIYWDGVR